MLIQTILIALFIHNFFKCNYHDADLFDELSEPITAAGVNFSVFHFNARSLPKHHSELRMLLDSLNTKFSVTGLSETWLNDYNADLYNFPGHQHEYICCGNRKRGVSVFMKNCIDYTVHKDLFHCNDSPEYVFLESNSTCTNCYCTFHGFMSSISCLVSFPFYLLRPLNT